MDDDQQFCLRWNNHQSTLISVFDTLLENGTLVDCTLAAEGKFLKAHKVVLCACSPYFASLLSQQYDKHPIFILKDVKFQELRAMMDYMYRGEVNISQDQLAALLKAAESLQIKGLSDNRSAAKGVDNAQQKQSQVPVSGGAAGSAAKTGLTIEQNKRLRVAADAELSGSREGSTSPSSRKRKKVRRRSVDTNNAAAIDNHDQMSNSSSQSATQQQAQPITSTPLTLSQITTATSAANVLNVTKKTDNNSNDDDDEEEQTIVRHKTRNTDGSNKDKIDSELLIEPKSEFEDGNDEPVEDLTMGDEDLMEDLEQAGPSHGGEGSSQGYQWQVDRSQDEVYLATQESSGQHRDAQDVYHRLDDQNEDDDVGKKEAEDSPIQKSKAIIKTMMTIVIPEAVNCDEGAEPNQTYRSRTSTNNDVITTSMSTNSTSSWQTHTSRIQSMVVQNDGSIILCDNESDIQSTAPHIEVVEILSPSNYVHAQQLYESRETTPIVQQQIPTERTEVVTTNTVIIKDNSSKRNVIKLPLHMLPKQSTSLAQRFACPRCGKDYSQQKNMKRHYRLECGQEPQYPCRICHLRFKRHNQMNGHMLTRHGIKDDEANSKVLMPDGGFEI